MMSVYMFDMICDVKNIWYAWYALFVHMFIFVMKKYIWQFLICCFIQIGPQSAHKKMYQRYIQIYPRDIQDIQDKRGPGLGPGRAGPAAAWYFVFILDILDISWIFLDILLVYFCSGGLGCYLDEVTNEKQTYIYIYIYIYLWKYI